MMRTLAFVVAALGALASCPEDKPPPDAREFITSVFNASVVCFPSFLAQAEPVFLDAQSRAQIEVAIDTFNRHLANDKVTFDRTAYDECLAAATANNCDVIGSSNGPCASVFEGKVAGDGVCAESVECGQGLSCFQDRDACGTCTTIAIEGTSCESSNCSDGDFCNDSKVCAEKPSPAKFNEGDACSLATGCGGVLAGLACTPAGLCAKIDVVEEGDACSIQPSSTTYCKDSASTHTCENDLCTKRPGLGEPCNSVGACDATVAACIDGTCADAGNEGDDCATPFQCKLGTQCREGKCTALASASTPPTCH